MDRSKPSIYYAIGFILLAVALASILAPIRLTAIFRDLLRSTAKVRSHTTINMTMARTPVYFFSHGGVSCRVPGSQLMLIEAAEYYV